MRKLIIIPAYNEGMNIEATVKDIQENAPMLLSMIVQKMIHWKSVKRIITIMLICQ